MKNLQLENDLKRAIEQQELLVYYQPIVSLNTGKISSFEALVRWQHPQLGMLYPLDFLPISEETGLITDIDNWVLNQACYQLRQWQLQKIVDESISMNVNISNKFFEHSSLIEIINNAGQNNNLDLHNLTLEISEAAIMQNREAATIILQQLKELNIQLSIDNFGTSYCSVLSYLCKSPLDFLGIDKSFTEQLTQSERVSHIISAINTLAHSIDMKIVGKGIETPEQLSKLRDLQCDFGQGYLFAKPLDVKSASAVLESAPQW